MFADAVFEFALCIRRHARREFRAAALPAIEPVTVQQGHRRITGNLVAISPHALNGSLMYAGAWLSLVLLGIYHRWRNRPEPWLMLLAAGVFTLSLFFRSMDKSVFVRSHFSHGVHFLWHVFNGVTL